MTQRVHILISGRDDALLRTRSLVLRHAGYRVSTTMEPIEPLEASGTALLIVCHTLSTAERQQDLSTLASTLPKAKALCLVPHAGSAIDGAAVLDSFCGPREMLRVVEHLLST